MIHYIKQKLKCFYNKNVRFFGKRGKVMENIDKKKEVYFANMVIGAIDNVETPMLMYEEEKQVVRKALKMYINKIEDKMYGN